MSYQLNLKGSSNLGAAAIKQAIFYDGSRLWSTETSGNSTLRVATFNGSTFTLIHSYALVSNVADQLCGDGTYVYVATHNNSALYAFQLVGSTITLKGTGSCGNLNTSYCDASYIYIGDTAGNMYAFTFDGTNFVNRGTVALGAAIYKITGNGTQIFVSCGAANTIQAYTFNGTNFVAAGTYAATNARGIYWDNTYLHVGSTAASNPDYTSLSYIGGTFASVNTANIASNNPDAMTGDGTFIYSAEAANRVVALTHSLAAGYSAKSVYTDASVSSALYNTICVGGGYIFYCSSTNIVALKNEAVAKFTSDKTQCMSGDTVQFTAI
jgi:hypothetical protein